MEYTNKEILKDSIQKEYIEYINYKNYCLNEISKVRNYLGKKVRCKKSIHVNNDTIIERGEYYIIESICGQCYDDTVIVGSKLAPLHIDTFLHYFELKTKEEWRIDKINKVLNIIK